MSEAAATPLRRLPTRVLVCGGRKFANDKLLNHVLDHLHSLHDIACIIEGGATGADDLASQWAQAHGIENIRYPANWALYGKAAGPIRNKHMLQRGLPHMVVAFPSDNPNGGTANMVGQARKANVVVVEILSDGELKADGV